MQFLFGIDEAGRGPLAGPVYAACCILPEDFPVELLNDSKDLSSKKRNKIEPIIKEKAIAFGIGFYHIINDNFTFTFALYYGC